MATNSRIRVKVSSPYEGGTREWSCGFYFSGADPTTAEWEVLADNVRDAFKLCLPDTYEIIESIGYDSSSDIAAFTRTEAAGGSLPATGTMYRLPLFCAGLIRWSTSVRSSKGHPIYCFNYVHGPIAQGGADKERLDPTQVSAMATFAAHWVTGFSDGSGTRIRTTPGGAEVQGSNAQAEVTHRDFPR